MNTKKSVYEKLFSNQVELEKHDVELAMFKSVKEIEAMYAEILAASNEASKYVAQLKTAQSAFNNIGKQLNVLSDKFTTEAGKTIAEAKGLGLEVPKNVVDLVSFSKGFKTKAANLFKVANAIDANIKNI
jgi:hypothetical protein